MDVGDHCEWRHNRNHNHTTTGTSVTIKQLGQTGFLPATTRIPMSRNAAQLSQVPTRRHGCYQHVSAFQKPQFQITFLAVLEVIARINGRWLPSSPSLADCLFHCHHRSNARCNEQPGSKKLGTITDSSGSILTNLTQLSTFTGLPYTDQYLPCYEVPCVIYFTLPGDTCCVLQQPACRRKRTRPFLIRNCVTPPSPRADGITKTSRLCASIVDSRRSCFGCLRFRKIL